MSSVIKIKHLNKTFNNKFKAVDDLSFEVSKSSCFGLLGPNGAGKTTTMSMVYGITEYDKVRDTNVNIFSFDPLKHSLQIKSLSGIVPQDNNLDLELNVYMNLLIYSKFYGMRKKDAANKINELLEFMELDDRKKSSVRELSGGMKRRLTIARALLNNPKLLILDEPTTGLDPQVRHLIWNKVRALKESGTTILLTTHYMEEAFQICDNIIIMDKGKKVIEGKPRQLLKDNLEEFVMEFTEYSKCCQEIDPVINKYNLRKENFKETYFIYGNNFKDLETLGKTLSSKEFHIRPSNLEDLFLKVTGRSLNESQ